MFTNIKFVNFLPAPYNFSPLNAFLTSESAMALILKLLKSFLKLKFFHLKLNSPFIIPSLVISSGTPIPILFIFIEYSF